MLIGWASGVLNRSDFLRLPLGPRCMNQEANSFSPPRVQRVSPADPLSQGHNESAGFNEALRFLRRRSRLILVCIVGTVALAGLVAMSLPPRYTGSATLVFARSDTRLLQTADFESETIDFSAIETELDVLRTRLFLGRVVDELKLVEDPAFNPSLTADEPGAVERLLRWPVDLLKSAFQTRSAGIPIPEPQLAAAPSEGQRFGEAERERALGRLRSSMRVWRSGDSLAVSIQVTRNDPKSAASLANAIGHIYIDWSLALKRRAADEFFEFFRTRAGRLEQRISELEREIADFSARNGLAATRADDVLRSQIDSLSGQLARATAEHAGTIARLESGRNVVAAAKAANLADSALSEPVLASPLLAKLRGDLADLARREVEMAASFGPNHAEMQAVKAQIDLTKQAVSTEVDRILDELETEVKVIERTIERYKDELAFLDEALRARAVAEIQLRELESNLVFERRRYDEVVESLSNLDRQAEVLTPSARFLSEAAPPTEPSFPNMPVILVGSGIASTVLAVMVALLIEATDNRIRSSSQLRRITPLRNFGMVPRAHGGVIRALVADRARGGRPSTLSSALDEAWCAMVSARPNQRMFMVASGLKDEGRTDLATGLAATAALQGRRVLLVGLDPGQDYSSLTAGSGSTPIFEVLAGRVPVEQAIVQSRRVDGLAFLGDASGDLPFARGPLQVLLRSIPKEYDLVFVDAPPLLLGHESDMVAEVVDSVVLAVGWGVSTETSLSETLDLAHERAYPLAGTVIAQVNEPAHAALGYGGRAQYRRAAR